MVRQFNLLNEKDEKFSLMNMQDYCLLTSPAGLGYSYSTSYEQLANLFVQNIRTLEQGKIEGIVNFLTYENFWNFVNYIENAESLRLEYIIPFNDDTKTFYRDVQISNLSKTEKTLNGVISESITFNCTGLWYQEAITEYGFGDQDIVWDFRWDPFFADYTERTIEFENDGHTEAPFQVSMTGNIIKPKISVIQNNQVINSIAFPFTLLAGETLQYSSKENELYIRKIGTDGTITNLFNSSYIDINNTNIFTLPKGTSILSVSAENDIYYGNVDIYKRYKIV